MWIIVLNNMLHFIYFKTNNFFIFNFTIILTWWNVYHINIATNYYL